MLQRSLGWVAVVTSAVACAQPPAPPVAAAPAVDTAAVVQAMATLTQRVDSAEVAGSASGYAAAYSESGRIDYPGFAPLIVRGAIEKAAAEFFAERDYTSVTQTPDLSIVVSNSLGYQSGRYVGAYAIKGKKMVEYGRYASAAAKEADGQWRLGYLMAFTDSTVADK
jgi:ketosteroid isomerase-like protein